MTERIHDQIADCEAEIKAINDAADDLLRAVSALVSDFAVKYPAAETSGLTEDFASRLDDIVNDLEAPAENRKMDLEDQIAALDERDLYRNAPVVL